MSEMLRAVGYFELIYVATSDHNFPAADALFRKEFVVDSEQRQQTAQPGMAEGSGHRLLSALPLRPQFTTLLLRFSYPPLQRNEVHGSRHGSELTQ